MPPKRKKADDDQQDGDDLEVQLKRSLAAPALSPQELYEQKKKELVESYEKAGIPVDANMDVNQVFEVVVDEKANKTLKAQNRYVKVYVVQGEDGKLYLDVSPRPPTVKPPPPPKPPKGRREPPPPPPPPKPKPPNVKGKDPREDKDDEQEGGGGGGGGKGGQEVEGPYDTIDEAKKAGFQRAAEWMKGGE